MIDRELGQVYPDMVGAVRESEGFIHHGSVGLNEAAIITVGPRKFIYSPITYSGSKKGVAGCLISDGVNFTRLFNQEQVTFGRNLEADVLVMDPYVSPRHAHISFKKGRFYDNSLNGSKVKTIKEVGTELTRASNDSAIDPFILDKDPVIVKIGGTEIKISRERDNKVVIDYLGLKTELPDAGSDLVEYSLGRDLDNDFITIDRTVSHKQARIFRVGEVFWIQDCNSKNGTFYQRVETPRVEERSKGIRGIINNIIYSKKRTVYSVSKLELEEEFVRWAVSAGQRWGLQNIDELKDRYHWIRTSIDQDDYLYARELSPDFRRLRKVKGRVERNIGLANPNKKPLRVLLIPSERYLAGCVGVADGKGRGFVVNYGHESRFSTFGHEYTHAYLGALYDISHATMVLEGAAVYFGEMLLGDPSFDVEKHYLGATDVLRLDRKNVLVGLSHTEMLDQSRGNVNSKAVYNYSYRFGAYFTQYFINKFGREAYLAFYKNTCGSNIKDDNGNLLVANNFLKGRERDLIAQAIRNTSRQLNLNLLTPQRIESEFDLYLKRLKK